MKGRAGKYNITGIRTPEGFFRSPGEYARWRELKLLEKAEYIKKLERQPKFPFVIDGNPVLIRSKGYPNGRQARYTADFAYLENGKRIVEDFKGFDTPDSRLRRAIAETIYGIEIRITGAAKRKAAA